MTWNPRTSIKAIQATLQATNRFAGVVIGEPFGPPPDLTAALMFQGFQPAGMTLSGTIDNWEIMLRIYARGGMTPEDAETVEIMLATVFAEIEGDLAGGFTVSGSVRAINWYGEEAGPRLTARWGHVVLGSTIFRVIDLTLPLIVDDSAQFVA